MRIGVWRSDKDILSKVLCYYITCCTEYWWPVMSRLEREEWTWWDKLEIIYKIMR